MLSVFADKCFVTEDDLWWEYRVATVAGDKSLFSPLDIEKKGIQRPFSHRKSKSTPGHFGLYVIQCRKFARELRLWVCVHLT